MTPWWEVQRWDERRWVFVSDHESEEDAMEWLVHYEEERGPGYRVVEVKP